MPTTTLAIKINEETKKRLKDLANARDRSPHYIMVKAIDEYLAREEKHEREQKEDLDRWEEYLTTGESVDNETVKAWLKDLSNGIDRKWPS